MTENKAWWYATAFGVARVGDHRTLTQGQLIASGLATYSSTAPPGPVPYGVVGCTGEFRTARGQVTISPLADLL